MKTILIADDNAAIVELLWDVLGNTSFNLRVARDGREALAIAAREPVDLVLLDVVLPGLSGYEVCAALKKLVAPRPVRVIMISAVAEPPEVAEALISGADAFLGKPFSPMALLDLVKETLGLTSQREEAD